MANQILLPNNCRISQPCVFPENWDTANLKDDPEILSLKWRITYRFYDDNTGDVKPVKIESFNTVHTLKERRTMVQTEMSKILKNLEDGKRPTTIKQEKKIPANSANIISDRMPFIAAIEFAYKKETATRGFLENGLPNENPTHKFFMPVLRRNAEQTGIDKMPMREVGIRHIKELLEWCAVKNDKTFSNDQFNRYRTMLYGYYRELCEMEIAPANLPGSIKKKKPGTKKMRDVMSDEERAAIDAYLAPNYPTFHTYTNIFYHSGGRSTELFRVRIGGVDLENQVYKCRVEKGRQFVEVLRVIPDVAVKYWKRALEGDYPDDYYLFSKHLRPGPTPISADQITKRWYRLVKKATNADGSLMFPDIPDFYSIKHNKVADLTDEVGIDETGKQFTEKTSTLTKHYDHKKNSRGNDKLRKAGREFGATL